MHGTYRRVSYEDGEYGDGDKMEETDANDYYAWIKMCLLNVFFSSKPNAQKTSVCQKWEKSLWYPT